MAIDVHAGHLFHLSLAAGGAPTRCLEGRDMGNFCAKLLITNCVSPFRRYLTMSSGSWGLAQGFQRSTETRRCASAPGMSVGRSK